MISTFLLIAMAGDPNGAIEAPPRSIDGRRFILPARVAHPFVVPAVTFRQGGGTVVIPNVQQSIGGGRSDLRMVGAVERINIHVPLRPHVGLRAAASAQVTTGIDADSALYAGARAGMDWELDATFVVHQGSQLHVSINPGLFGSEGTQFEPATVVTASMALLNTSQTNGRTNTRSLTANLLQPTHTFGGGVAGAAAWRFGPRLGGISSLRFRGGTAESQGVWGLPLSYALGAAVDWKILEERPLVGQIEYRFRNVHDAAVDSEAPLEDRLENRHFGGLGVYWRTTHEAELGLTAWSMLRTSDVNERLMVLEGVVRVFL